MVKECTWKLLYIPVRTTSYLSILVYDKSTCSNTVSVSSVHYCVKYQATTDGAKTVNT
jgi:hypothetical protein